MLLLHRYSRFVTAALFVSFALALAACGGDTPAATPTSAPSVMEDKGAMKGCDDSMAEDYGMMAEDEEDSMMEGKEEAMIGDEDTMEPECSGDAMGDDGGAMMEEEDSMLESDGMMEGTATP